VFERPEHSTLSWIAMLFSTGIGTAILYWGTIEWVECYKNPPFEMEPRSEEALKWSASYGMFHWGIIGWSLYCTFRVLPRNIGRHAEERFNDDSLRT
jgi:BCCT family betaine/carnitine transporter